jgi:hypothetical protein
MKSGRAAFAALLVVALAAYAFDCGAAANPEQAMQCCNSMPCSSGATDQIPESPSDKNV